MSGKDLWTDGLLCAFELVQGDIRGKKSEFGIKSLGTHADDSLTALNQENLFCYSEYIDPKKSESLLSSDKDGQTGLYNCLHKKGIHGNGSWVAIGWGRISELVQQVHTCSIQTSPQFELIDNNELTVAEMAGPCLEKREGPTWWCHVSAAHPFINSWLINASWLHPAISVALRDESKLISEKMKHLFYEVPVRVDGGLLFELLGQSVGDPYCGEGDTPIVLRSWQSNNFLLTALHVKGSSTDINVLGILEVQESISYGNHSAPRTIHELIAFLVVRLTLWDDRLFRKHIFGEADEIELKFMNRRNHEDMNLFSVILNQEIRKLSRQVIRVKWSLHAREEIVFELMQYLRGNAAKIMLHDVRKRTREMINEQEAVRGRLFTIQDVIQSTVRSWLQDKSLRVTHNLTVFGGCGLVLSIITGLFGINVDGIPGSERTPYAFLVFTTLLFGIGAVLIGVGLVYLGLKKPVDEEEVEVRKLELQDLVKLFHHEAETHTNLHTPLSTNNLSSFTPPPPHYLFIQ